MLDYFVVRSAVGVEQQLLVDFVGLGKGKGIGGEGLVGGPRVDCNVWLC